MQSQTQTVSRIPADRLPAYVADDERAIAALVVSELIAAGYALSVFDGEEWTLRRSRDAAEVCAALASTDADMIRALQPVGQQGFLVVGSVTLIWGNGNALVSDWSSSTSLAGAAFGARLETIADEIEARFM